MPFVKPAALFVCVALAGCAGKSDPTETAQKDAAGKPSVAQQAEISSKDVEKDSAGAEKKSRWWSFGGKDEGVAAEAVTPNGTQAVRISQAWLDDHEKRLRAAVAGSKFEVERRGDTLVVVAPVDPSFNKDRPHMLLPVTLGPLSRVAKLAGGDPHAAVLVIGHADSSGDAARNRQLSLERAQAIASIFRMSGLRGDRLVLRGFGADKPRASNDNARGRAQNRRVEVLLTVRDSLPALLAQSSR